MACNATRIELSNAAATTIQVTLTTDPGDGTTVILAVPELSLTTSGTTSSGVATLTPVSAVSAATNSLWDATIQVGVNRPAVAEVMITETNTSQTIGVTVTDSAVSYCAPLASGVSSLDDLSDVTLASASYPNPVNGHALRYNSSEGKWKSDPIKQSTIDADQTLGENNTDVTIIGVGGTDYPSDGQVLNWIQTDPSDISAGGTWSNIALTINADQITAGTIDNARLSLAIDDLTDCTVDKTADYILYTNGSAVRSRAASNWSLSEFTNDLVINDLGDVNIAMGAGNDGDVIYYDHAAGAGAKIKGSPIADLLPAVQDSYLMLIEAPSDKDYTIDARVAAGRTVTNFYAKTSAGTCTATLKNLTDATTIGTISVTSTGGSAASLSNTTLDENDRVGITISSTSSAADLELVVEYTQ